MLSYGLGLITAILLDRHFPGRGIYRTILLIPWIVPPVVSSLTWRWMFSDLDGYINTVLRALGIIQKPILWLSTPHLAFIAIIIANVWRTYPFFMINMLAALGGIPDEIYEAAKVDGARISAVPVDHVSHYPSCNCSIDALASNLDLQQL